MIVLLIKNILKNSNEWNELLTRQRKKKKELKNRKIEYRNSLRNNTESGELKPARSVCREMTG